MPPIRALALPRWVYGRNPSIMIVRTKRYSNEINGSSIADIAFLLLIFFMVTTTMTVEQGIPLKLPVFSPEEPKPLPPRNVLTVLINTQGQLMVEGEAMAITQLRDAAVAFIDNRRQQPGLSDSPQKAVISLQCDRSTDYATYLMVLNELKAAYNSLRDSYALEQYGQPFKALAPAQQQAVAKVYPVKLSEAEWESEEIIIK